MEKWGNARVLAPKITAAGPRGAWGHRGVWLVLVESSVPCSLFLPEDQEVMLDCGGDGALELGSILGELQKPPGHGPGCPAPGGPAGLGEMGPEVPAQFTHSGIPQGGLEPTLVETQHPIP